MRGFLLEADDVPWVAVSRGAPRAWVVETWARSDDRPVLLCSGITEGKGKPFTLPIFR